MCNNFFGLGHELGPYRTVRAHFELHFRIPSCGFPKVKFQEKKHLSVIIKRGVIDQFSLKF